MAGPSTASTSTNTPRRRTDLGDPAHPVPPGRSGSDGDRRRPAPGGRPHPAHARSSWTACPSCACWRATPCATAGRSWPSRTTSPGGTAPSSCWTTGRPMSATCSLQSLCHGVLLMEELTPEYGSDRRRLRVTKMRGLRFRGGFHDFTVDDRRPARVPPAGRRRAPSGFVAGQVRERPAGAGRPVRRRRGPGHDDAAAGAVRHRQVHASPPSTPSPPPRAGERAAFYTFDERLPTLFARSAGLGIDLQTPVNDGRIVVQAIDPAELTPGEFIHRVRRAVEQDGARRRRHRQPLRLPARHVRDARPAPAAPRAADVSGPAGRQRP